jgi:hypothetical protein
VSEGKVVYCWTGMDLIASLKCAAFLISNGKVQAGLLAKGSKANVIYAFEIQSRINSGRACYMSIRYYFILVLTL